MSRERQRSPSVFQRGLSFVAQAIVPADASEPTIAVDAPTREAVLDQTMEYLLACSTPASAKTPSYLVLKGKIVGAFGVGVFEATRKEVVVLLLQTCAGVCVYTL